MATFDYFQTLKMAAGDPAVQGPHIDLGTMDVTLKAITGYVAYAETSGFTPTAVGDMVAGSGYNHSVLAEGDEITLRLRGGPTGIFYVASANTSAEGPSVVSVTAVLV